MKNENYFASETYQPGKKQLITNAISNEAINDNIKKMKNNIIFKFHKYGNGDRTFDFGEGLGALSPYNHKAILKLSGRINVE